MQRSISEWLTDDDIADSHISRNDINITPPALLLPLSDPEGTLSPILCRPRSSEERSKTTNISCTPPISETLNRSAGAASLRKDLATCEKIMTEKHEFLVEILDKMNNGVSSIENKLIALETRVQALEDNEHKQMVTAQNIFQASNERQNDLGKNQRDCISAIQEMTIKSDTINALTTKIKQMEHSLSHQKHTTTDNVLAENTSIAIYGLRTNNDIITTVNHLFDDLNLRHINCISAYRTPARPNIKQNGVVIAQLSSINDKREVLDRKRYLRNMAQYRNVFLKSSKSHAEQVMNANFNLVLNERSNGDAYFISDNDRIIQKNRNIQSTGLNVPYSTGGTYLSSGDSHGGARPKNTHYHSSSRNQSLDTRINQYSSSGSTSQGVVPNYVGGTQDISRGPDKPRSALNSHHYDHHNMSKNNSHTNQITQQYNGYSVYPQYNQRLNRVPSSSNQMYPKKNESGQSLLCPKSWKDTNMGVFTVSLCL